MNQPSPIARLTERQKEYLRRVRPGHDSKRIARQMGVSHHTVNKAIEAAMAKLGATDRYKAAEMLRLAERGASPEWFVHDPFGVERQPDLVDQPLPGADPISASQPASTRLNDSIRWSGMPAAPAVVGSVPTTKGSRRNDLSSGRRLHLIGLYTFGILVVITLLMVSADSLYRLLSRALGSPE